MGAALALLGVLLLLPVFATAGDKTLVIGVDERDWIGHYSWVGDELTGIDAALVREVAGRMGYEVTFKPYPWARVIMMVKEGSLDGVLDLAPTPKRRAFMHYVKTPVSAEAAVFWVKRGNTFDYQGSFDKSMRLGLMNGSDWSGRFAREGTPTVERFKSVKAAFLSLLNGRIDAFGGYYAPTQAEVEQLGLVGQVEPADYVLNYLPYYIAFSMKPGHAVLAESFGEALRAYYDSPEYTELLEKYGITGRKRKFYPPPMIAPFAE